MGLSVKPLIDSSDPVARLLAHSELQPDHPAVVEDEGTISYGAFGEKVRRMAAAISEIGEAPRVMVHLPQGTDAYAAMFATMMAGGFYCPVDIAAPPVRSARVLENFDPDAVVTREDFAAKSNKLAKASSVIDPARLPKLGLSQPQAPDDLAYVIFTSGSTGKPKGVMVPRHGLSHYSAWATKAMSVVPEDRWSQHPNIAFDLSVLDIYGALCSGATLYPLTHRKDRLIPADAVRRHRLTIWNSVPSVIDLMRRANQATSSTLSSLRLATFCGEPLLIEHLEALFTAHPGLVVHNTYGPTEATVSCTLIRLDAGNFRAASASSVALGNVIGGMRLDLLDGPDDSEGEVVLSGPQLARGYWNDSARTDAAFVDVELPGGVGTTRAYRTGDWAAYRDGNLFFRSRTDGQVKIHGHRLELGEIDAALRNCGASSACTVLVDETLHSFVEGIDAENLAKFRVLLLEQLPPYAIPASIHPTHRLPRNANDKIDAAKLSQLVKDLHD